MRKCGSFLLISSYLHSSEIRVEVIFWTWSVRKMVRVLSRRKNVQNVVWESGNRNCLGKCKMIAGLCWGLLEISHHKFRMSLVSTLYFSSATLRCYGAVAEGWRVRFKSRWSLSGKNYMGGGGRILKMHFQDFHPLHYSDTTPGPAVNGLWRIIKVINQLNLRWEIILH